MKKEILQVNGHGRRVVIQKGSGTFNSTHKQEDIEKWLEHNDERNGDMTCSEFDRVFGVDEDSWEEWSISEELNDFEVDFNKSDEDIKTICKFDDEIQRFLDKSNEGTKRK